MKYLLKGKLSANLSPTFKEPIGNVKLRFYRIEDSQKKSEIKPKHAFTVVSEEMIGKNKPLLIAETMTDPKGNFTLEMDEGQSYDGGPLKIDVYIKNAPGQRIETGASSPIQFTISILQPRWQKNHVGHHAYFHPRLPWRHWCAVRRWMDAWTICGQVLDSATNAPVSGATVWAFDADRGDQYDKLGHGTTNTQGKFRIDYSSKNFVDFSSFEEFKEDSPFPFISAGPDLFFRVETPNGATLLKEPIERGHSPDRENAGPCFWVDLSLRETGNFYVAGNGAVTVVDIASNTVVDTIAVGGDPMEVAFTPDGAFAYVANLSLNDVSVINTATRTVVDTIPVGGGSRSLAMAPDGSCCYVSGASCLWVIDTAARTVSATIPFDRDLFGGNAWDVVITQDGAKVYIALYPDFIAVIDTATNTAVNFIGMGSEMTDLAFSPDGTRLYAANQLGGTITVIDTATDGCITEIETNDDAIYGIGITPDGARAYTGGFSYISVVDIFTGAVIANLPCRHCGDVEITPGGTRAYISSVRNEVLGAHELYVIDTATNTLIATIPGVYGDMTIAP